MFVLSKVTSRQKYNVCQSWIDIYLTYFTCIYQRHLWLFHGGGKGGKSNVPRQHFNQKDHRSCPSGLPCKCPQMTNYPLSWDNAFHFCRIFPSRVKVGLWSWGETRTCQLLMLGGRSPKVLFFYGESSMWIPIELMDVLLSLMYFLLLTGNFFLWMYNQVLSRQDVSLFKEIAAS